MIEDRALDDLLDGADLAPAPSQPRWTTSH